MTGLTPYARVGNFPVVIGAGMLLGLAVWRRRRLILLTSAARESPPKRRWRPP